MKLLEISGFLLRFWLSKCTQLWGPSYVKRLFKIMKKLKLALRETQLVFCGLRKYAGMSSSRSELQPVEAARKIKYGTIKFVEVSVI